MFQSAMNLTDEQRIIVDHTYGPALVFAVAGAGKTTTMAYRIERLVRDGSFAPERILATSFGKATVRDIEKALRAWPHCTGVKVKTLHSIGFSVLNLARRKRLISAFESDGGGSVLATDIFWQAVSSARRDNVEYRGELNNVDKDDFFTYIDINKGNLRYADLVSVKIPTSYHHIAGQAEAPKNNLSWYLDLYRRFETIRLGRRVVTFSDMVMEAWHLLVKHEELRHEVHNWFDCILIDEYQDVNLAQEQLISFLTATHNNIMAIGDDDQTIYEWRGADPRFILDFERKHRAKTYVISDNFRSHARHLALANHVIKHNKERYPKQLSPTRGLGGMLEVTMYQTREQMAREITGTVEEALLRGHAPSDIVVLVRAYAQTAIIEHALITQELPYSVIGNPPFYNRDEVKTLLAYLRLGLLEQRIRGGYQPNTEERTYLTSLWETISGRPNRYLKKELVEAVGQRIRTGGSSVAKAVQLMLRHTPNTTRERLEEFLQFLDWLVEGIDQRRCGMLLAEMVEKLRYMEYLRSRSGFAEQGRAKAENAKHFIDYAAFYANAESLLTAMDEYAQEEIGRSSENAIQIITTFRAKGLQWPVVIVPDCDRELYPAEYDDPEESRRLFYVALTRTQEELHLFVKSDNPTPFLEQAKYKDVLRYMDEVSQALQKNPEHWTTQEVIAIARYTRHLNLRRFLRQHQWKDRSEYREKAAATVLKLYRTANEKGLSARMPLKKDEEIFWLSLKGNKEPFIRQRFSDLESYFPVRTPNTINISTRHTQLRSETHTTTRRSIQAASASRSPFKPGDKVHHKTFGRGIVVYVSDKGEHPAVKIRFGISTKLISLRYGALKRLL
jgi:DNA helicase-2/ATP-dependent DNA helicase PcrA